MAYEAASAIDALDAAATIFGGDPDAANAGAGENTATPHSISEAEQQMVGGPFQVLLQIELLIFDTPDQERPDPTPWPFVMRACAPAILWNRPPQEGLPPPGNTVLWLSKSLQTLDEYLIVGEEEWVFDCPPVDGPPTASGMTEIPQPVALADFLPISTDLQDMSERRRTPAMGKALMSSSQDFEDVLEIDLFDERLRENYEELTDLPQDTSAWLDAGVCAQFVYWDIQDTDAITFYTDGSYADGRAAWAFVVEASCHAGRFILGYQHGQITKESHIFEEACKPSAHQAELYAMVWATWWILRLVHHTSWQGRISFAWDAMTAGYKATGDFKVDDQLGHVLRCLQQALEAQLGADQITHRHVFAHTGCHPNEIADAAAKAARSLPPVAPDQGKLACLCQVYSHEIPWLWFRLNRTFVGGPAYCHDLSQMQWQHSVGVTADQVQDVVEAFRREELPESTVTQYELHVCSYNALSLHEEMTPEWTYVSGKIALVRALAEEQRMHIIGIQEARTQPGMTISKTHNRFASGAAEGNILGVELWISRTVPFAKQGPGHKNRYFQPEDCHIVHADPRVLLCHLSNSLLELYVCVCGTCTTFSTY